MQLPHINVYLPDWTAAHAVPSHPLVTDDERMEFVIRLARENVERGTGGPFAAAVFDSDSGALVALGVNLVSSLAQSVLHAEVVAIMMAQQRVGSWTLRAEGMPQHELFTTCEPCAMCLGAVLWSGVRRLVCGATRDDAMSIGFDEGPVYDASYKYLADRGIEIVKGVRREAASEVLQQYVKESGVIYNG